MKKETSALDLYYLVKELKALEGSKLNKVYQNNKEFLLDFYKSGQGKIQLRVLLPNFVFLTKYKHEFPKTPPKYCEFLRKRLINAILKNIQQRSFERILELNFESRDKNYLMIIELFSKGNMILCDEDRKIISPLQPQSWQARTIRGGTQYEYPPEQTNAPELSFEEFKKIIKNSGKNSIVKCLATELSLSGIYAEELCARSTMNKDTHPNEIDKEADSLFKEMKQLFDEKINANLSDNQVLPFKFKTMEPEENFESFSKAADEIISRKLHETEFEEQQATERSGLAELNRIIKEQEETIEKLEKESEVNNKKGQLVFEKYQELSKIFEQVNKDRKEMPWEDLKKKYKNYKFIKEISKEGKILVDI